MSNHLVPLFLLFTLSWARAEESVDIKKLSRDPHWLKLLHYSDRFVGRARSDVLPGKFFLSRKGRTDPLGELEATVEGLANSGATYCSFPARRVWLEGKGMRFTARPCPAYDAWTRGNSVKSVSMIFASGFLGNPASYFGHPLLKFNFKDERSPLDLLDTAVNYGAFTPPDVDPLSYMFKGVFGGFEAGFSSVEFFFHRSNYIEMELRDLWEYELDLPPGQVNELVAHVWEMREAKINYYFTHDNCAFRMGELLELVSGAGIVQRGVPWAIPASLFHRLNDKGVVKDVKLLKSRQTRLREKFASLDAGQREQLKLLARDARHLDSEAFKERTEEERSEVLEVGLDYYSFLMSMDKDAGLAAGKKRLLVERLRLPPRQFAWKSFPQRPPHEAQRPVLAQFGAFHSEKWGDGGSLRLRPAFYDMVSPDAGRPSLSGLSVVDLELNATGERLWIKTFNLVSVENMNISETGLRNDGGMAWRFNAGADQLNLACNTCTVAKAEVGGGWAWELARPLVLYAMVDPRVQSQYAGSGFFNVKPSLSLLASFTDQFRLHASAGRRFYVGPRDGAENVYSVEARAGSARGWDVRLSFQEHVDRRYGIGLGTYW